MRGPDARTRDLERAAQLGDGEAARQLAVEIARREGVTDPIGQTRSLLRPGWRPFGCPEAREAAQLFRLLEGRQADPRAALRGALRIRDAS